MYNSGMDNIKLQNLAEAYWRAYAKKFPFAVADKCPTVEFNNRFTSTGGVNYSERNLIQLAKKFYVKYPDRMLTVTLPHELAHQIDFNLYGWTKGERHHRQTWKNIMVKIGLPPDIYHDMVL
jgi:predicted SprT family Zn-dependent metalloprotease